MLMEPLGQLLPELVMWLPLPRFPPSALRWWLGAASAAVVAAAAAVVSPAEPEHPASTPIASIAVPISAIIFLLSILIIHCLQLFCFCSVYLFFMFTTFLSIHKFLYWMKSKYGIDSVNLCKPFLYL